MFVLLTITLLKNEISQGYFGWLKFYLKPSLIFPDKIVFQDGKLIYIYICSICVSKESTVSVSVKILSSLISWRRSGHLELLAMSAVALHKIIWRDIITALGQNGARSQLNTDYVHSVLLFIKSQLPDSLWQAGLPWSKYFPVTSVGRFTKSCSALWHQVPPSA